MIEQGEEIITSGFPKYNTVIFYENCEIVVQQWIYCVLLYFIYTYAGNIGLLIFTILSQLILFRLCEKILSKHMNDKFWCNIFTMVILFILYNGYFSTIRPENLTLTLLLLDCVLLDKYKETNKKRYLYYLPIITLLEINCHASMWMFHFCILLAYAFPNVFKKTITDNQIKLNKHVFIVTALMIISLFINPYGIDNIKYTFDSMPIFDYIQIIEQQPTPFLTSYGIAVMINILLLTICIMKKVVKSTSFYMSLGFSLLGMTSVHNSMFIVISMICLLSDILNELNKHIDTKVSDEIPNATWLMIIPSMIILIIIGSTCFNSAAKNYTTYSHYDPIVKYIKEHGEGNIINSFGSGSYLEFHDIKNIFTDSRPEMLHKNINKNINIGHDYMLFEYGYISPQAKLRYNSIDEYLKKYDIKYIVIDDTADIEYPYLISYIENTDAYRLVIHTQDKKAIGDDLKVRLYERIENDGQKDSSNNTVLQ